MGFPLTAIIALGAFCITLSTTEAIVVKPENSLHGPYVAGGENLAWWDVTGSAQLAESVIRITTDEPEKRGAIWNNFPNILNDWEFHIQFHIHGKGVHLNGDGMAIWYVREPLISGPIFGYRDHYSGFGLFIDTFENQLLPHNHRHPYISLVVNNGSQHYEHDEEGTVAQVGGCHVEVRNLEYPARIAITYISKVLTVFTDVEGKESWTQCFKAHGVELPTGYYFGVSASTGMVSDNHDVVSITTLDMASPDRPYEDRTHVVPYAEFVEIPGRARSSEEKPEELLQKADVKREVNEEEIIAEVHPVREMHPAKEARQEPEVHHAPETEPQEHKEEPKEHRHPDEPVAQPKAEHRTEAESEPTPKPTASFMRKAIYIAGIGVFLYVGIAMFRQYNARRKERIRKRLY